MPRPRHPNARNRAGLGRAHKIHKINLDSGASFDAGDTRRRSDPKPTRPVRAQCWCGRHFVWLTQDDVQACRTESCGERKCSPPN